VSDVISCPYQSCQAQVSFGRSDLYTPTRTIVMACPTCTKSVRLVMDDAGNVKASPG
jgi:hypothetical protein